MTHNSQKPFSWTDLNMRTMKQMMAGGKSAQEICDEIGAPSRSAVIGKMNRCKSEMPDRPVKPKSTAKKPVQIRRSARPPHYNEMRPEETRKYRRHDLPQDFVETPDDKKLTMLQLDRTTCRWPYGDKMPYTYCGQETHHNKLAYCPYHEKAQRARPRNPKDNTDNAHPDT